jgi:hypothetical protein
MKVLLAVLALISGGAVAADMAVDLSMSKVSLWRVFAFALL